ncbi:hypothetical protein PMG71_05325 [Roseofilum sp. BLCC_M154]|uniref:Uncharacterized protein n=1 Tax=Roseofilum acuticapitatum BLCC-M154 TaxID=3022444 RepID=A0ABT7APL8_9CYAN|nr:hypothetical protein [Roseofilum acuticapitatum]MDJ1168840.1 hypothetical protein [Roseofilum acuticapitatum BLCC-M154]
MTHIKKDRYLKLQIPFWTLPHALPVLRQIGQTFGGFTLYLSLGGWQNPDGLLVWDLNWVVEVYY